MASVAMNQTPANVEVVEGDLLDQDVEVIVNAWNRNIIPWWLLLPQGVSGAIKRRGGTGPFKEVAEARSNSARRGCADFCGSAAFQGHHSCRRNQYALAGVGTVDSRVREKCCSAGRQE